MKKKKNKEITDLIDINTKNDYMSTPGDSTSFRQSISNDPGVVVPHRRGDINFDGALELASKVLESVYKDYVDALIGIMAYKAHNGENAASRQKYVWFVRTKRECENFYLSRRFQIFTMGKSAPGEEIIRKIKKDVGFID